MNNPSNSMRLRPGITDPVVLMFSHQSVMECDVDRVMKKSIRLLMASREDVILYRQQACIVFDGFGTDPRELVDVPEVRIFVKALAARWPEWAYFFNQADPSIGLWMSCLAGDSFPGGGAVGIDVPLLKRMLSAALNGMNSVYEKHGLSEKDLEIQSMGFIEVIQQMV